MTVLHTEGIGMTSRRTRERMIRRLEEQGIKNADILEAMRSVPRHLFVDDALASRSYEDTALPIGYGQTISQPYIVAKMTELLMLERPLKKVLEIGTGCGYQTAVLAQLAEHVYSIERIEPLYQQAKALLTNLQIKNISYLYGDGYLGWPEKALYDGILVAAAPAEIPETLLKQMAVGGVMLIPIGGKRNEENEQILKRVTRTSSGYDIEELEAVSFVPFLTGVN
ncbi:MAG: protein-L-isoaspartate(D-aspartate) O-methyltransferase [Methyloprofundus sp.]|nr:protein-L-isoaspartate(D-aspartate) O-methyltransferase [Methyloprofundus sp.]